MTSKYDLCPRSISDACLSKLIETFQRKKRIFCFRESDRREGAVVELGDFPKRTRIFAYWLSGGRFEKIETALISDH